MDKSQVDRYLFSTLEDSKMSTIDMSEEGRNRLPSATPPRRNAKTVSFTSQYSA